MGNHDSNDNEPTAAERSSESAPRLDPVSSSFAGELPPASESIVLLERAQEGDRDAMSALFQRYQERLRRIVRVRLGSKLRQRLESMDIVQDAFVVATPRISDFEHRGTGSLLNWLARIAERQIQDQLNKVCTQKRDLDREVRIESVLGTVGGPDDWLSTDTQQPEANAEAAEFRDLVDEALMQLPDHYREVILLRSHCSCDWEFIARELGRPNGHAAEELYRRAGIKLRKLLRPVLRGS